MLFRSLNSNAVLNERGFCELFRMDAEREEKLNNLEINVKLLWGYIKAHQQITNTNVCNNPLSLLIFSESPLYTIGR